MPIDPLNDELLNLGDAARCLPNHPHPSTLWRWKSRGHKTRSGELVYLEAVDVGGTAYTTREALRDFCRRVTDSNQKRRHDRSAPSPRLHRGPSDPDLRDVEAALAADGL